MNLIHSKVKLKDSHGTSSHFWEACDGIIPIIVHPCLVDSQAELWNSRFRIGRPHFSGKLAGPRASTESASRTDDLVLLRLAVKCPPERSKRPLGSPQRAPRGPQRAPRELPGGPEVVSRWLPGCLLMALGGLQMVLRGIH